MALWQTAIQRRWARLIRSNEPAVPYTTEPAHQSLFVARRKRPEPAGAPRFAPGTRPRPGQVRLTKLERWSGCLPGIGPVSADVRYASVEVYGVPDRHSVVEVQSQAYGPDESKAGRLLERVAVRFEESHLRLLNPDPPHRRDLYCSREFSIGCPRERPVTVRGVYSAVHLSELSGGADIETTHARITLLNVGPAVNAQVVEGIIDYSGCQGQARLFAGWEINLNFTSPVFKGALEATAEGPIRVLLPPHFATSFEATVAQGASFVCRADIGVQIHRRDQDERAVYSFGETVPAIRLVSIRGPIVIDNAAGPWEPAAENAMVRPPEPTLPARASINPRFVS